MSMRKKRIMDVMADTQYPVIKAHNLDTATQIDWASGVQSVTNYDVGYTTLEIQDMLTQANSASNVSTGALIVPTVGSLVNQKMDYYAKTTKLNMKNTCSHTVYIEIQAFKCKGYHSFSINNAWQEALLNDDMVQNAATFGTEMTINAIGARPDMRMAHLNVRWQKQKDSLFKIALEPGQETSYTYVQPGGRFDQQKFNVAQGSTASPVDVFYGPFSTQIQVYCRAEMVADALDTDVTYGSGHISTNIERHKSWAAVPYCKPLQQSFTNAWGTVVEANELDLNQYQANNDPYEEQV